MPRPQKGGLPSRQQILDFIASSDQPAGKRELARAFGLGGGDKQALKILLQDMADEGLIEGSPGRAFHQAGGVPKVTVLRLAGADASGTPRGAPARGGGARGRAGQRGGGGPRVTVLRSVGADGSGTIWGAPERWESDMPEPRIR